MICEKCGGATYDNTQKVAEGWKGPLYKCKDPSCDWRKWSPKTPKETARASRATGSRWTWAAIAHAYERALLIAEKSVAASIKRTKYAGTTADVLTAAAAIFGTASRDGVHEGDPTPAEPLQHPPRALATAGDDDDLPF